MSDERPLRALYDLCNCPEPLESSMYEYLEQFITDLQRENKRLVYQNQHLRELILVSDKQLRDAVNIRWESNNDD